MKFKITAHEVRYHDFEVEALTPQEAQDKVRMKIVDGHEPVYVNIEFILCDIKKPAPSIGGRIMREYK